MRVLITSILLLFALALTDANAQRYKRDSNTGGLEKVTFEAMKNGGIIEFTWNINTTREISSIEIQKGVLETNNVNWILMKKVSQDEKQYVDYQPTSGQMFYKLVVIGSDGAIKEYLPVFKVKGKS